ncbi:hypothetical protein B296_00046947 [Ensete ventricosum]|uniref:TCP-1-eta n=1 Tax=Ensete ventricosum TaxID=4639 RepID=A0A426XCF1_ENSVE|nr:hypothetical protein B296_00046947 [Ensete ventricosum]
MRKSGTPALISFIYSSLSLSLSFSLYNFAFWFFCRLSDPLQYQSIVDAEWNIIYDKLDKCVKSGAKIVLSRLAIGDLATQMELSRYLRQHARTIAGKSQLFINSYAKALEVDNDECFLKSSIFLTLQVIPRQLCDNAGFDSTDVLNKLRQKHASG